MSTSCVCLATLSAQWRWWSWRSTFWSCKRSGLTATVGWSVWEHLWWILSAPSKCLSSRLGTRCTPRRSAEIDKLLAIICSIGMSCSSMKIKCMRSRWSLSFRTATGKFLMLTSNPRKAVTENAKLTLSSLG